jgi:hypothetical protein
MPRNHSYRGGLAVLATALIALGPLAATGTAHAKGFVHPKSNASRQSSTATAGPRVSPAAAADAFAQTSRTGDRVRLTARHEGRTIATYTWTRGAGEQVTLDATLYGQPGGTSTFQSLAEFQRAFQLQTSSHWHWQHLRNGQN